MLTTGEMIDKLKVGEVAESEKMLKFDNYVYVVRKTETGSIMTLDYDFNETGHYIPLQGDVVNLKWTIKPNYVPTKEAMKVLERGNEATLHISAGKITIDPKAYRKGFELEGFSLKEILEAKWSIGDNA